MTVELLQGTSWEVLRNRHASELLAPGSVRCVLTDPPYGVDFQSTYGKDEVDRELYQKKIEGDTHVEQAINDFHKTLRAMVPWLAEECEFYIFSQWQVSPKWQEYLESKFLTRYGIVLYQLLIWEKGYPGIGDVKYNWGCGHEFIYYLKRGRRRVPYRRSGILHVDKVRPGTNIHPTQKPVPLLKMLIEYSTNPGDLVLDPYAGSGSTLVAARDLQRDAVGIEYDAAYVERARDRLSQADLFSL